MLSASILDRFRLTNLERGLGIYGVHVYQEGQGAVEHRTRSDDRIHVWSVSKTFTSLAIGMCLDEGRLELSDTVASLFPHYQSLAAPGSDQITVRHLLQMSSGKEYHLFERDDPQVMEDTDWAELFFAGQVVATPGSHFFYSTGGSYMLSRVVEQVSGQVLRDYLLDRLFRPLGIRNPTWDACPRGHSAGGYGLHLTTSEVAALGQLLLQQGVWQDRALVSASYVRALHTDVIAQDNPANDPESNAGYGYQVWRNAVPGTYRAAGLYGQLSIVVPDQRAVVTTTAHYEPASGDIVRAVFADIIDRL
jgi:CubicO group peptidase (beta-lactamase class C family)